MRTLVVVSIIILIFLVLVYLEENKYKRFFNPEDNIYFEPPFLFKIFRICPDRYSYKDGKCHYYLNATPVVRKFTYCWFGELRELTVVLYKEANEYFNKIARREACDSSLENFYLKSIEDREQAKYIRKLVEEIKKIPTSSDNWARVAISLVQNIPYDYSRSYDSDYSCERVSIFFFVIDISVKGTVPRYPYNVLYENRGVCNEKSRLLATILKELGYGVVLLEFTQENHMSVGIKCPKNYANYVYNNTGYCFIEATKPSIVTYNSSEYMGVGRLYSEPKIIFVSDGKTFESVYMEYYDAKRYEELLENSKRNYNILSRPLYDEWLGITKKYCIQISSS